MRTGVRSTLPLVANIRSAINSGYGGSDPRLFYACESFGGFACDGDKLE